MRSPSRSAQGLVLALLGLLALAAAATPVAAGEEPKTLALSIVITQRDGVPVTDACFIHAQVREARRLMAPHRVRVGVAELRALEGHHALETARDRDALADYLEKGRINVFVVASLRDVDDPKRFRMGVRWRKLSDLRKDYVIVTTTSMPTTLAHELGHVLGNGHSQVVDNVMSYKRENPDKVHFDAVQGARMRAVARQLFLGKVMALEDDTTERTLATRCQ